MIFCFAYFIWMIGDVLLLKFLEQVLVETVFVGYTHSETVKYAMGMTKSRSVR